MTKARFFTFALILIPALALAPGLGLAQSAQPAPPASSPQVSDDTQACLDCHTSATPGIVADWQRSRMARTSPALALAQPELARRISVAVDKLPKKLAGVVVGCAECHSHTLLPAKHQDSFDHEGYKVHTVVTPEDCASCHPVEREEYKGNLMSHARGNLLHNSLYQTLRQSIDGVPRLGPHARPVVGPADPESEMNSCIYCHGSEVKVSGQETRMSDFGELAFPVLSGWPNHGVGRRNPDGSLGSCTPCHSRHQFAIEMARQPATCSECHKGPDVAVYKVYEVSKHGNIYETLKKQWDFSKVPWTVGQDFNAPTCAACHVSLLQDTQGNTVVKRSHKMADRIWWRLLGLIYSHPHPVNPDTSLIRNADGQPLPTTLAGQPATKFLIDAKEQATRRETMLGVCQACHTTGWIKGYQAQLEASLKDADARVLAATGLMQDIWHTGLAQQKNPFDEAIEKHWQDQWLLWGNSVRFAAAMLGPDLGVFEGGRWDLSRGLAIMEDWRNARQAGHPAASPAKAQATAPAKKK